MGQLRAKASGTQRDRSEAALQRDKDERAVEKVHQTPSLSLLSLSLSLFSLSLSLLLYICTKETLFPLSPITKQTLSPSIHRQSNPALSLSLSPYQLLFLRQREPSPTVGSLVACGSGGWVQVWNTSGGGLVGEFNIWDNRRHSLSSCERGLHSVTAMHVNETETVLFTGNSLGYLQVPLSPLTPSHPHISSISLALGHLLLLPTQGLQ